MDGRVLQVNVSPGGVPKLPVAEARVGRDGLDGDAHDHDAVHGGPHRAVCLLASEAIERVRADGHPGVGPGSVGENLTTEGIELSLLPVGARLAIGDEVVLEISGPANPCDVIKDAFVGGKSGRISILLHPTDSRMYARVERDGVVRPGDAIRVLPARLDTNAAVHHELDLLDSVERDAWLAMWRAAAEAGIDVRVLDKGDTAIAASPDLPGSVFNRAFGMRQVPIQRPRIEAFFRDAGVRGWLVAGIDDPEFAGREPEWPVGVHRRARRGRPRARSRDRGVDDRRARDPAGRSGRRRRGRPLDRALPRRVRDRGSRGRCLAAVQPDPRPRPRLSAVHRRARRPRRGRVGDVQPAAGRPGSAPARSSRRRAGAGSSERCIADRVARAEAAGSTRVLSTAEINTISAANLEFFGIRRIWTRAHYRVEPA